MDRQEKIEVALGEARIGSSLIALIELEELIRQSNHPQVMGWLGYCLAKEKQDFSRALVLCTSAVDSAPDNSDLYLALGRVYHLAGRRYQALTTLRKGLKMGRNDLIVKEMHDMGVRKDPVFRFLDRENMVNIVAGRVTARFGMR